MDNPQNPRNDADLVVDFAAGLLDENGRRGLLERAESDPLLEAMLRDQLELRERQKVSGIGGSALEVRRRWRPSPRWWWSLAGVGAVAILLVRPWSGGEAMAPDPTLWIPVDRTQVFSRSPGDAFSQLDQALVAYADRDAERAAQLLEAIQLEGGLEDLRQVYLAGAYYQLGRFDEAAEVLAGLDLTTLPQPWRAEASKIQVLVDPSP